MERIISSFLSSSPVFLPFSSVSSERPPPATKRPISLATSREASLPSPLGSHDQESLVVALFVSFGLGISALHPFMTSTRLVTSRPISDHEFRKLLQRFFSLRLFSSTHLLYVEDPPTPSIHTPAPHGFVRIDPPRKSRHRSLRRDFNRCLFNLSVDCKRENELPLRRSAGTFPPTLPYLPVFYGSSFLKVNRKSFPFLSPRESGR